AAARGARGLTMAADPLAVPLRVFGERLFDALFSVPIRSRLDESLGLVAPQQRGLRLRLQISLADPALGRLQALPWEYLYRAEHGSFLGLSSRLAIVRTPALPLAGHRATTELPLRLLALPSQPKDMNALALEREIEGLESTWKGSGLVEVDVLRQGNLDCLRAALQSSRPHILHVMGHGDFEPRNGEGVLYLAGERGQAVAVDGALLADHLRDCPSVQLVFLNACRTALSSVLNPFAGMATALLQTGVPAVVAMQHPIHDEAALAFSAHVYRQLARHQPIETAVAEGRLAIRRQRPDSMEWGTPVLFLRAGRETVIGERDAPLATTAPTVPGRRSRLLVPVSLAVAAFSAVTLTTIYELHQPQEPIAKSDRTVLADKQKPDDAAPSAPGPQQQPSTQPSAPIVTPQKPPQTPPTEKLKVPSHKTEDHTGQTAPQPHDDTPRRPASNGTYKLSSEAPVHVTELDGELSVQFQDTFGEKSYRLFLSAAQGFGSPPQLGPGRVEFTTARGTVAVDVQNVDRSRETVVIHAQRPAA
ncbi:MAG TPA: CHAT domain-containing protein, partial [Thermoanaerobaculia bacterium]